MIRAFAFLSLALVLTVSGCLFDPGKGDPRDNRRSYPVDLSAPTV